MIKQIFVIGASDFAFRLLSWAKSVDIEPVSLTDSIQIKKLLSSTKKTFKQSLSDNEIMCINLESFEQIGSKVGSIKTKNALFVSFGSPWIFPQNIIKDVFMDRIINIHGTPLPKMRGGTIFSWQILTGQRTGMCLIHKMTDKIDQGPVIAYEEFIYPSFCRKPLDYIKVYEERNFEFVKRLIEKNKIFPNQIFDQPEYLSSYLPRLKAEVHGWINWNWDLYELERFICAFDEPYAGARCKWRSKTVILKDVWAQSSDGYNHPFQYGNVYRNNGKWINVTVKEGELLICSIRDEHGAELIHKIKVGDRLYTLPKDLSKTIKRVIKSSQGLTIQKAQK
jgi:methionyl-tRNA formyltransferase